MIPSNETKLWFITSLLRRHLGKVKVRSVWPESDRGNMKNL